MNVHRDIPLADLYETDFHSWLTVQARALRGNDASALDWANLAEEIESLGKSQLLELRSRVATILAHLLKVQFGRRREPAIKWRQTLLTQRQSLNSHLDQNPSLRRLVGDIIDREYDGARKAALLGFEEYEPEQMEHYHAALPDESPYSAEQVLDDEFLPNHVEVDL